MGWRCWSTWWCCPTLAGTPSTLSPPSGPGPPSSETPLAYSGRNPCRQFSLENLPCLSLLLFHSPPWGTALLAKWLRRPPRKRKVRSSNPACDGIFLGRHTSDLKIGTPVATLLGAWRYRVSTGTGCPGVSILWLGEVESLVCNFYLSVAARTLVWVDRSLRYTGMLLGCYATTKQTTPPRGCPTRMVYLDYIPFWSDTLALH